MISMRTIELIKNLGGATNHELLGNADAPPRKPR
jgi:hypothetical protein